jgi:hypothetical protein
VWVVGVDVEREIELTTFVDSYRVSVSPTCFFPYNASIPSSPASFPGRAPEQHSEEGIRRRKKKLTLIRCDCQVKV